MNTFIPYDPSHTSLTIAAGLIFLTEVQLAERWQVSVKKLQADRYNGRGVQFAKIGRSVRYRLADVLAHEELSMFLPPRPLN